MLCLQSPVLEAARPKHQHHDRVGPFFENVPVIWRYSHDLCDHYRRYGVGKVSNEVNGVLVGQLPESLVNYLVGP